MMKPVINYLQILKSGEKALKIWCLFIPLEREGSINCF